MSSVKKNFLYNIFYHILTFIIPLILSPYLSRVIHAKGIGIYSYTYSIVYYFMLLTLLGVNNYGNRTIAKVRDDKTKLSKTFWSIYLMQLIMGIIMLILYFGYIFIFNIEYRTIALIQSLFILSSILDINWFFWGMEEFKKTIGRNTIVKILNAIMIVLIVRNDNDLWKYALIMGVMTCISQLILWIYIRKYINIEKIMFVDIKNHFKPNIVLFIPVIAVSLYKIMDKIMLGSLANVTEVGYYENAEKIINMPMTLITALGTIMIPKISNLSSKGEIKKIKEYINKSENFVMFVSFAMCFGLIGIGYHFAPFFFGKYFQKTGLLIMLLATTLPFLAFANVLRTQFLIPREKDKIYIKSVFLGAITNLIMNFIFIPIYKSIGACIGTIMAEFIVMFYQAFAIRKELPIKDYLLKSIPFFIKSLVMLALIYPLNYIKMNSLIRLILQISLGSVTYVLLNFKYIYSLIDVKKIMKKFHPKKN